MILAPTLISQTYTLELLLATCINSLYTLFFFNINYLNSFCIVNRILLIFLVLCVVVNASIVPSITIDTYTTYYLTADTMIS